MSRVSSSTSTSDRQVVRRLLQALLAVAGFAMLAHLIWSAVVVNLLDHYQHHRLLNIRKTKSVDRDWEAMSSAFVHAVLTDAKKKNRPSAIFIGSSLTYGYPWQEPVIFSRVVAERLPDWRVGNLSIIGAGMRGLLDHATCPLRGAIKPDVLVVEIPLVNSIGNLDPAKQQTMRECSASSASRVDTLKLVLSRPYGLGWISLLWDEEAYEKPEENIQIAKLPSDYFATAERFQAVRAQFRSELEVYLNSVAGMGKKVLVYVSPVYTPGIEAAGGDRQAVEAQMAFAYEICKENGKVICIDPASFGLQREMFYNLTHLNQKGHRVLGEWFAQQVLRGSKP